MTEFFLPPDIAPAQVRWGAIDSTAISVSDTLGAIRTSEIIGGYARTAKFVWPPMKDEASSYRLRSRMRAVLDRQRGQANRLRLGIPGHAIVGSFPATELFTNNTFASGTTGWGSQQAAISVSDRVLRLTVAKNISAGPPAFSQSPTVTAYAPHIMRGFLGSRSRTGLNAGTYANSVQNYSADPAGLITQSFVPLSTSAGACYPVVYDSSENITITGDWIDCPYTSLARCALIDNGPNNGTYSDQIDNAAWTKSGCSVTANAFTSPAGTATGDKLIEDGTTAPHYIWRPETRASAVADWCVAGAFRRGDTGSNLRDRVYVSARDSSAGTNAVNGLFDLTSGTVVTTTTAGSGANARAFIQSMGDGWYYCAIVGQLPASGTTVGAFALLVQNPSTTSYTGDSASNIGAWGITTAQSSVPVRLSHDTTTARPTGTAQSGTGLYIKGLPASTDGLLLPGAIVQTGNETHIAATRLDSDAAGCGYFQLTRPPRSAPANDSPLIVLDPMGRFLLANNQVEWVDDPGLFSSFELEVIEATVG